MFGFRQGWYLPMSVSDLDEFTGKIRRLTQYQQCILTWWACSASSFRKTNVVFQSISHPVGLPGVTSAWAALKELLTPTPGEWKTATLRTPTHFKAELPAVFVDHHGTEGGVCSTMHPQNSPRHQCPAGPCQDHGLIIDRVGKHKLINKNISLLASDTTTKKQHTSHLMNCNRSQKNGHIQRPECNGHRQLQLQTPPLRAEWMLIDWGCSHCHVYMKELSNND